ncbi:hypothetical protein DYY64_11800 [Pasteurella multocida]|nr:hypothetical protein DYY64_11800 [Pasteurella multocida]
MVFTLRIFSNDERKNGEAILTCLYCSLKNWKQAEKLKRFSKESLSRKKSCMKKGMQVFSV